ncbi:MAG: hypothetical protein RM022_005075 [Nostoc sp. EfeVER01]|nr:MULTISPECIES: hypothetical protein [unclassified Nostoc]MDZ7947863.1 hypothetical protein [Nostoc sp. EfeVER01]MDZ7994340.1 hypothetical protein [Nostoc sp. EspVER01]
MSKVQHRDNLIDPPNKPVLGQTLSRWNTSLHEVKQFEILHQ